MVLPRQIGENYLILDFFAFNQNLELGIHQAFFRTRHLTLLQMGDQESGF